MSGYRDELKAVSEKERVALPEGFQINPDVLDTAEDLLRRSPMRRALYRVCPICEQGLYLISDWRGTVTYADGDCGALMLDHAMKRHGWTRETIGDQ